ncbi:MAG: hypothetical protein WCU90_06970 [Kiritimatiellia bacterium]
MTQTLGPESVKAFMLWIFNTVDTELARKIQGQGVWRQVKGFAGLLIVIIILILIHAGQRITIKIKTEGEDYAERSTLNAQVKRENGRDGPPGRPQREGNTMQPYDTTGRRLPLPKARYEAPEPWKDADRKTTEAVFTTKARRARRTMLSVRKSELLALLRDLRAFVVKYC